MGRWRSSNFNPLLIVRCRPARSNVEAVCFSMIRTFISPLRLYILLVLSFLFLNCGNCSGVLNYGVALTTIPPRFGVLHHQLRSWLNQSIAVNKIRIFVPKSFKRFRSKRMKRDSGMYKDQLLSQLNKHLDIAMALHSSLIEVVDIEQDWGPLSKFVGIIQNSHNSEAVSDLHVDYWIFCDDDLEYAPSLAEHYAMYIDTFHSDNEPLYLPDKNAHYGKIGFTMFTTEHRLQFQLQRPDGRSQVRNVPHIQGVDSYIIPSAALSGDTKHNISTHLISHGSVDSVADGKSISPLGNASNVLRIISRIHNEWCPESFYQDDYIVSTLLNLSGVYMHSARLASPMCSISREDPSAIGYCVVGSTECTIDCSNGLSLANSIDGVSKHHFQMHMKEEVFMRETITQQCLMTHANEIRDMLFDRM